MHAPSVRIGVAVAGPREPPPPEHVVRHRRSGPPDDALHRDPYVGYIAVWGVSNNSRSYYAPTGCERLGYQPHQNSEDDAAQILAQPNPLDPIAQQYQGGQFVTIYFTPFDQRSRSP